MSAFKCFLALICLAMCGQLVAGYRMKLNRQDALQALGGKAEAKLNFSSCDQSSNEHTCSLAFDNDATTAWTQCATTGRPASADDRSWWRGYLENPSYISSVSIQNAEWAKIEEIDGMLEFTLSGNGHPCYTHQSPQGQSFGLQSFPCDILADDVEIRTAMTSAVLGIAEVTVYGAELNVMNVLFNNYLTIKFEGCDQSSIDYSFQCFNAIDNIKSQEAMKHRACSMTQADESPWWVGYFSKPAIVDHVIVLGPSEEDLRKDLRDFAVTIGNQQCGAYKDSEPLAVTGKKFTCNLYGSQIKIEMKTGDKRRLTLCEVNVQGFPIEMSTPNDKRASLGCFPSDPKMPVLPDLREPASYTYMHLDKCDKICRRFKMKYFGVQAGLACWCGNHSPASPSEKAPGGNGTDASNYNIGNCVVPCEGNRSERCGGVTHVHVYELK